MRYYSYINTAKQLLQQYSGELPFHHFSKNFFSQHKKYGSKDRKQISHLCYCYFRIGQTAQQLPLEERILLGLYLCSQQPSEILAALKPQWNDSITLSVQEKCNELNIFPYLEELSSLIDTDAFYLSHLQQPALFLRVRPGYDTIVTEKLTAAKLAFTRLPQGCCRLSSNAKVDDVLELNKEVVVQDYSTQQMRIFLEFLRESCSTRRLKVWDCCAASGGKSILAQDVLENVELTVSDIRKSILVNLQKRFTEAGIQSYRPFVCDLTKPGIPVKKGAFDLIIADVPCTGSGTWGRTPEQLLYFKKETIEQHVRLQQNILTTIIPLLPSKGYLLYSTCSVFKKENEEIIEWIKEHYSLKLIHQQLIKGYTQASDSFFGALFQLV